MEAVLAISVSFVLGIVGTLLVEWRFRPRFEQRRRAQERWENELQQLLELLEIRLPRLTQELNHFLDMARVWEERSTERIERVPSGRTRHGKK